MIFVRQIRLFVPIFFVFALAATLTACDDPIEVKREYPSTLSQADYLKGLPTVIPVHLDAVPAGITLEVEALLQTIAAELSRGSPVRFATGRIPDGRQFALRISMQPAEKFSALSLCQGKPIGRQDARQRSLVVIAAICDDRRRLGEVRAVRKYDPQNSEPNGTAVIESAVRKLFALPHTS